MSKSKIKKNRNGLSTGSPFCFVNSFVRLSQVQQILFLAIGFAYLKITDHNQFGLY